jgi:membrane protein
MIFLLSLLPYLPVPHLEQAIMGLINQALPEPAARLFTRVVHQVTTQRKAGLLSVGALGTLWAASNGMYAVMQQLNIIHGVKEGRNFFKLRGTALFLTALFGGLIIGAFALVAAGGLIQGWLTSHFGATSVLPTLFAIARWAIITFALVVGLAWVDYLGPDAKQELRLITPGSIVSVAALIFASLGIRVYVGHFSNYAATYGSLGAVVILMLWLYVAGAAILLGSEINTLLERFRTAQAPKIMKKVA